MMHDYSRRPAYTEIKFKINIFPFCVVLILVIQKNILLAICFLKKQSPPSAVFEDRIQMKIKHSYFTVVILLQALLIFFE